MTGRLLALALAVAVAFDASCAHSDARVTAVERGAAMTRDPFRFDVPHMTGVAT